MFYAEVRFRRVRTDMSGDFITFESLSVDDLFSQIVEVIESRR